MHEYEELIKGFASSLKLKGKQKSTIESYSSDTIIFVNFLNSLNICINEVDPHTLLSFQTYLSEVVRDRTNSVRRKVISIRQFYRYLLEVKFISTAPFDYVPIPERNDELPTVFDEVAIHKLCAYISSAESVIKKHRDIAIIRLLAYEGLKANEVINLKWSDFDNNGKIASLRIRGDRIRVVELYRETARDLENYRGIFNKIRKANPIRFVEDYVFIALKGKDGVTIIPKITRHGLKFLLYELGNQSGIRNLNTEALRHFAIDFRLSHGVSPEDLMSHLGLRRLGIVGKHLARRITASL